MQNLNRRKIQKIALIAFRAALFCATCAAFLCGSARFAQVVCRLSPLNFWASLAPNSALEPIDDASAVLSVLVLLLCVLKRRFYCRCVCPLGAALDACAFLRRKAFKNRFLKFGLTFPARPLFAFFATFWALASIPFFLIDESYGLAPALFEPTAILSRAFVLFPKTSVLLIAFLLCFVLSPLFWRYAFCPCGALQEALYLPKRLGVKIRKKFLSKEKKSIQEKNAPSRRQFLGTACAISLSGAIFYAFRRFGGALSTFFFRPPGALPEARFLTQCARCGRCVDVCPTKILKLVDKDALNAHLAIPTVTQIALPRVDFTSGYCQEDCLRCGEVCPTGAIRPLTLETKAQTPIGLARLDLEKCMLYYNRECSICRRECPYDAISFVWSDEEYIKIPTIDEKLCVGCGRCVAFCPGEPSFDDEKENDERPKALRIGKPLKIGKPRINDTRTGAREI